MPIYVELRDRAGARVRGLTDPSGGAFDAAGDFDRFLDERPFGAAQPRLPVLGSVDPYADTEMSPSSMDSLIADVEAALLVAKAGPERRGLLRLQVLAECCAVMPGSTLNWKGD